MIEYHADDYGLFPAQSRHIADCYYNGALNGISIMPNSPYLKECMDEIEDIIKDTGEAILECHFCNRRYKFNEDELKDIISSITR